MLTVHHLASSQSERIVWLCEELGLPYEIIRYERDPATRLAPPEYKALHPFGTSPVITEGAFVLAESNAIVAYLLARYDHGQLARSPDHPDFAQYLIWLHFANGSFIPSLMTDHILQMVGAEDSPTTRMLRARGERALQISEQRLSVTPYFAGDNFSAADIMMVAPLKGSAAASGLPYIGAYLQRIAERQQFQVAMGKAEPGEKVVLF